MLKMILVDAKTREQRLIRLEFDTHGFVVVPDDNLIGPAIVVDLCDRELRVYRSNVDGEVNEKPRIHVRVQDVNAESE